MKQVPWLVGLGIVGTLAGCADDDSSADPAGDGTTTVAATDTTSDGLSSSGDATGVDSTGVDGTDDDDSTTGPPPESQWHTLASMPAPRQETAVAAVGGQVYVLGGLVDGALEVPTVEVYDPGGDAWQSAADLPAPMHHAHVAAFDGALYLLGSLRTLSFTANGESARYDPESDGWTPLTAMPVGTERGGGIAVSLDEAIVVIGGLRGGQAVSDVWAYVPADDAWLPLADLPTPRDHLAAAVVDGLVYAIGGRDGSIGSHTTRVDVYDPSADAWSEGPAMPTSRGGVAAAVAFGQIFVAGGEGNEDVASGVFPQFEVLDPAAGTWASLPDMPTPRHGMGAAAVDGTIYVPGGAITEALGPSAVFEAWGP